MDLSPYRVVLLIIIGLYDSDPSAITRLHSITPDTKIKRQKNQKLITAVVVPANNQPITLRISLPNIQIPSK